MPAPWPTLKTRVSINIAKQPIERRMLQALFSERNRTRSFILHTHNPLDQTAWHSMSCRIFVHPYPQQSCCLASAINKQALLVCRGPPMPFTWHEALVHTLLHVLHLKHILCHDEPTAFTSSAAYTDFSQRAHLTPPPNFGGMLAVFIALKPSMRPIARCVLLADPQALPLSVFCLFSVYHLRTQICLACPVNWL